LILVLVALIFDVKTAGGGGLGRSLRVGAPLSPDAIDDASTERKKVHEGYGRITGARKAGGGGAKRHS